MRWIVPLFAATLAVPLLGAPPSKPVTLERKQEKNPGPVPEVVAAALSGTSIGLQVLDGRGVPDPELLGAQEVKGQVLYTWRSTAPLGGAITSLVAQALASWNVAIDEGSDRRLEIRVAKFAVNEVPETFGSSYRAEVELRGGVRGLSEVGGIARRVTGTAKRKGPDGRARLCNEALVAALDDALVQLLSPATEPAKAPTFTINQAEPSTLSSKDILKELVRLKEAGVGESVLLGYVRQRRLTAPLSAEDILEWKSRGLPESVIEAAQVREDQ